MLSQLTLLALPLLTSATPLQKRQTDPYPDNIPTTFSITQFKTVACPGGDPDFPCTYSFTVSGAPSTDPIPIPPFTAACAGSILQPDYADCGPVAGGVEYEYGALVQSSLTHVPFENNVAALNVKFTYGIAGQGGSEGFNFNGTRYAVPILGAREFPDFEIQAVGGVVAHDP